MIFFPLKETNYNGVRKSLGRRNSRRKQSPFHIDGFRLPPCGTGLAQEISLQEKMLETLIVSLYTMLPMVLPQNLCLCHQRHGPSGSPPLGVDCRGGYALRLGVSVFLRSGWWEQCGKESLARLLKMLQRKTWADLLSLRGCIKPFCLCFTFFFFFKTLNSLYNSGRGS